MTLVVNMKPAWTPSINEWSLILRLLQNQWDNIVHWLLEDFDKTYMFFMLE